MCVVYIFIYVYVYVKSKHDTPNANMKHDTPTKIWHPTKIWERSRLSHLKWITFRKRATNCRPLLRKMTWYEYASYENMREVPPITFVSNVIGDILWICNIWSCKYICNFTIYRGPAYHICFKCDRRYIVNMQYLKLQIHLQLQILHLEGHVSHIWSFFIWIWSVMFGFEYRLSYLKFWSVLFHVCISSVMFGFEYRLSYLKFWSVMVCIWSVMFGFEYRLSQAVLKCLIFTSHFPQKRPTISGSFAESDPLQMW